MGPQSAKVAASEKASLLFVCEFGFLIGALDGLLREAFRESKLAVGHTWARSTMAFYVNADPHVWEGRAKLVVSEQVIGMPVGVNEELHTPAGHLLNFGDDLPCVRREIRRIYDQNVVIAGNRYGIAAHDVGVSIPKR